MSPTVRSLMLGTWLPPILDFVLPVWILNLPRYIEGGAALPFFGKVFRGEIGFNYHIKLTSHWGTEIFLILSKRNITVESIRSPKECFCRLTCLCRISKA